MLSNIFLWAAVAAANPAAGEARIDYVRDVRPLLQERCYACHGALKQKAKLRLDSGAAILQGGTSGPAVTPGNSAESVLIQRVDHDKDDSRMPPEGQPLKLVQIAALKAWIDQGAKFPTDDKPEPDPRDHWAFRAPVRPAVPKTQRAATANPIDAFIAAEWEKRGLQPQPLADKRLLLRRVSIDLTGLPPTQEETAAFLADTSTNAYAKVVDRLLASPQYGERWGRHWMDVWRYSDWWGLGAEVRNSQKHIWHWRDWIVESLNADRGYDQMVREMLAADELYPTDLNKLRASGFLARQYFIFNRTTWMDETIEHTSKAFLGLTINCCKCHDHKYDPIAQTDYYRLRAFFEPYQVRTDMLAGETDFAKAGLARAFDCNLTAPTYKHERGDDRRPITSNAMTPGLPDLLAPADLKIEPVALPLEAYAPHLRPHVEETYVRAAEAQVATARDALAKAKKALADAGQLAANTRPEPIKNGKEIAPPKPVIKDDFKEPHAEIWELGPGHWKYNGNMLLQLTEQDRATLKAIPDVPADFEAKFRFAITAGGAYKSVGMCFDIVGDNEVLAYVSAASQFVQIAYKYGKSHVYPPDTAKPLKFKLGDSLEMVVRVRGQLVNVAIDGEHAIAFRLPGERKPGKIALITYTALAEFRSFQIAALPANVELVEPKGGPAKAPTLEQAKAAHTVAERSLAAAELQIPSLKARFAAERAKLSIPPAANATELVKEAAKAEKAAALAKAEEDLARNELELAQAATAQKPAVQKKRDASKMALTTARKAAETPGDAYTPPKGARKTPENNLETEPSLSKPFPTTSTGRRSALANWIADQRNPLAARVAVNHIWSRHFGKPLVATVFDFGRKGAKPTHPELLDWLAVELMENNWSMKHLHRLIVTSEAYRLGSSKAGAAEANLKLDEENQYLWRMNSVRMQAQTIRDAMLHLSGKLDLTMGGPPIDANAESTRRSIYFVHSHNDHQRFLMQFDDANVLECYRRTESIVPQQALTLANSKFALTSADAIAARLQVRYSKSTDAEFLRAAMDFVLGTKPTEKEEQAALKAMADWTETLRKEKQADPAGKCRADLIWALLNHNDFVTVR